MVFSKLRSALDLLACQSLCLVSVVRLLSLLSMCSFFVHLLKVFCRGFSL